MTRRAVRIWTVRIVTMPFFIAFVIAFTVGQCISWLIEIVREAWDF